MSNINNYIDFYTYAKNDGLVRASPVSWGRYDVPSVLLVVATT